MDSKTTRRSTASRLVATVAMTTGSIAILAVLYLASPESTPYFPKCLFHLATGLHCPGCGAARCFHSLANGEVRQAAAYNVLVLSAVPFLVYAGLQALHARLQNRSHRDWKMPTWLTWSLVVVVVAFGIVRNLDFEYCRLFAPHRLG